MKTRHALVIGASSGIGRSIAQRLKREGFFVSGISRRMPPPDTVDAAQCCDVLDAERMADALPQLAHAHGVPGVVVYTAGYPVMGCTLSIPEKEARQAFETHFWGLDRVVKAMLPIMKSHGGGTILAVLSIASVCPPPFEAYYAASKAAASAYLRSLSREMRRENVRLKWIAPGYVDTGFLERGNWFGMPIPQVRGSGVTPEQIAAAVVRMIHGGPEFKILGWKERLLAMGERLSPSLSKLWFSLKR
ncbi:MAG: SDR family oxidoreductase [Acidobacteria bacterium]|nr:SDR family oxidoreductase [Acidobacteriota bacterium]